MVALSTLYERVAEQVWPGQPVKVTASGGSTSTFVASSLTYSSADAYAYDGRYIYLLTDAGGSGAAPETEERRVTTGGYTAASGSFAISPNWSTAVVSTDVALFLGMPIEHILDSINDIQRTLKIPRFLPVTLVTDGDMEASAVASWTAVGTPGTNAKSATNALLRQAHHVAGDDTVGVKSAVVPVHDVQNLYLSVPVKIVTGSVNVTLYDETNAEVIKTVLVEEVNYPEVRFTEPVPNDCVGVTVRILAAENTTEWYTGWVSLLSNQDTYSLPGALTDPTEIEGVFYLPGDNTDTTDLYIPFADHLQRWSYYSFPRDWRGTNRFSIGSPTRGPIFLSARIAGPTLSAHSDVSAAPEDLVVYGAASRVLNKLAERTRDSGLKRDYAGRAAYLSSLYFDMLRDLHLATPKRPETAQRMSVPW